MSENKEFFAKIDMTYRVSLPPELCRELNILYGSDVVITLAYDAINIKPTPKYCAICSAEFETRRSVCA